MSNENSNCAWPSQALMRDVWGVGRVGRVGRVGGVWACGGVGRGACRDSPGFGNDNENMFKLVNYYVTDKISPMCDPGRL